MDEDVGLVKAPRICEMICEDIGYGFNLHGEKGVIGQYISAIDKGGYLLIILYIRIAIIPLFLNNEFKPK